jgi:hypothetical protein
MGEPGVDEATAQVERLPPHGRREREPRPWLALAVGIAAVILFTWVIATLGARG